MLKIKKQHSPNTICFFIYSLIHYVLATTRTCAEVSLCQGLQDGVHGPHVEDEAQLGDTHGDEAQQENGTEDTLHEGLSCRGDERGEIRVRSHHFANTSGFLFSFQCCFFLLFYIISHYCCYKIMIHLKILTYSRVSKPLKSGL